jgi:hypothetical protein
MLRGGRYGAGTGGSRAQVLQKVLRVVAEQPRELDREHTTVLLVPLQRPLRSIINHTHADSHSHTCTNDRRRGRGRRREREEREGKGERSYLQHYIQFEAEGAVRGRGLASDEFDQEIPLQEVAEVMWRLSIRERVHVQESAHDRVRLHLAVLVLQGRQKEDRERPVHATGVG